MKFIATGNTAGDCTTPYDVKDYKAKTVGEFVKEVLESFPNEWGYISVGKGWFFNNPHCEYENGKLLGELQETYLDMEIEQVMASGGWSRMDYEIVVKEQRENVSAHDCGNCCWSYGKNIDGDCFCACKKGKVFGFVNCRDLCDEDYVSIKKMRHHMAVLLQDIRWNDDQEFIHYAPDGDEATEAKKFAYKYMKVFGKL